MSKQGVFIISMDFELNWGVHDVLSLEQYEENLMGTREAIDKILELFKRYEIHATWATVGLLFFRNKEQMMNNIPSQLPSYSNVNFSPYEKFDSIGENEKQDPFHYGESVVLKIASYAGQEISSHTFSHYYCLEKGQTAAQFEADLTASIDVIKKVGFPATSIVFPRNQVNDSYLPICEKHGIQSYRGNEKGWMYKESKFHNEGLFKRIIRLVDCYVNITGHNTYRLKQETKKSILNLPSSRFLRPYNAKLKKIEWLRLRRIKKSMTYAAKNGEVYHLWWHPHNFGKDIEKNINFLTQILELSTKLKTEYGLESLTMEETTAKIVQASEKKSRKSVRPQIMPNN